MSLEKVVESNPTFDLKEVISEDGDYVLAVGKMGDADIVHYFAVNTKYGVIEGSCTLFRETPDMMAHVTGKDRPVLARAKPVDIFN